MSVVSLDDVKNAGKFESTASDTDLQSTLNRAESMIARKIGPLTATAVSEVVNGQSYHLTLTKYPFGSLTSVISWAGASIDVTLLYTDAGVVRYVNPYAVFWEPRYTVAYSIGFTDIPDEVMQGIIDLTRHLWRPRNGPNRSGGNSDDAAVPWAIPNRVLEVLGPYIPLPDA